MKIIYIKEIYIRGVKPLDNEYYIDKIKVLLNEKRFGHSLRVADEAVRLAECYGVDKEKAYIAGILHDYAKNLSSEEIKAYIINHDMDVENVMLEVPELAHGIVGAKLVKDNLYIVDEDILNSIRYHTTGRVGMTILEKIIYIADYIEPKRNFPGVDDVRDMAYKDIDKTLVMALDNTFKFLIKRHAIIHPLSLRARNYYLRFL